MDQLCSQFVIGSSGLKMYQGMVLVDTENVYMLVGMNVNLMALGALGGAIGGAIAGVVAHVAGKPANHPFQTTYAELPDEIRQQPAWGRVAPDAKIIVIPRAAATAVKCSIWTGCHITTSDGKFTPNVSVFRFGRARRLLEQYGWLPK